MGPFRSEEGWAWRYIPSILPFGRLRQEDPKFKVSLVDGANNNPAWPKCVWLRCVSWASSCVQGVILKLRPRLQVALRGEEAQNERAQRCP